MFVTLDPCNLAIARAQWVSSNGAPAILGLSGDGKQKVLAERSGLMKFDWSLAGQRDPAGGVSFVIAAAAESRESAADRLAGGIDAGRRSWRRQRRGAAEPGLRHWRIDLGGRPGCRLRLVKPGGDEARPQAVLAKQAAVYDFSLPGVVATVTLAIEAHREPLRKLTLDLDPALDLVEVASGGDSLSWDAVAATDLDAGRRDKSRRVSIVLPPSLEQGAASLRLRTLVPLSTGSLWKLPRMTFPGVVCRSNSISLVVPSPLRIDRLETHGCHQTGAEPLKTSAGEQLDFEAFLADSGLDVAFAAPRGSSRGVCRIDPARPRQYEQPPGRGLP